MITSCLECRRRKLKCDKQHPCTNCNKFARECMFLAPALDTASQLKLTEIKEKMGSLERVLEQDVARKQDSHERKEKEKKSGQRRTSNLPGEEESEDEDDQAVPDDERGLEPTPLAVVDASYEDDADDDMLDLGIRLGKMRVTDRIGGFFRPKFSDEVRILLSLLEANQDTDYGSFLSPLEMRAMTCELRKSVPPCHPIPFALPRMYATSPSCSLDRPTLLHIRAFSSAAMQVALR